jgi:hypothetical protein
VVGVTSTTQLISPGWNQHRPWLTGSWVMQRPPAFMQEAGAAQGQEQVPPLMALPGDEDSATAEYLLVDDLLTVMMGQVRVTGGLRRSRRGAGGGGAQRVPAAPASA